MNKKLFGTDGIRAKYNEYPLTPEMIKKIGRAIASFLILHSDKKEINVVLGRDTRASGIKIKKLLVEELNKCGVHTTSLGIISTPALSIFAKDKDYELGIMITASHNPNDYNGIKLFNKHGKKLLDEEELEIEKLVLETREEELLKKSVKGNHSLKESLEHKKDYLSKLTTCIPNLKVILDCANGAAYELAPKALEQTKADFKIIGNNPNGTNINKDCGALFPKKLSEKVVEEKADIGIALDGDADRIIVVDEQGKEINGDKIMAIIASHLKKKNNLKNNSVVVTHYSNLGFDEAMNKQGIEVKRVGIGDAIVRAAMDKNDINFGGEQAGHIILSDYVPGGDGLLVGIKLLEIMQEENKKISELASIIQEWPQKQEAIMVKEKIPLEKINGLKELKEKLLAKINGEGRIFLRYSGTEPKLRVMVECKNEELLEEVSHEIMNLLKKELE